MNKKNYFIMHNRENIIKNINPLQKQLFTATWWVVKYEISGKEYGMIGLGRMEGGYEPRAA